MKLRHLLASLVLALPAFADTQLPPNARVAIIGDSITEQKLYSRFIETYLLGCTGRKDIKCFQFGWSGETAQGFSGRLENDLSVFKPTVATTCYGMNDGRYVPYDPSIGANYEKWMRLVLEGLKKVGVTNIVTGSPGAVDTRWFVKPSATADQYNDNLAHLRDIDKKLAAEYHTAFANVHDEMISAMAAAKAKLGANYDVGGRDGVHPGPNGQLLMAAAFLKGLGLDGHIGDITVDMKGASTGSEGHTVKGSNGVAEIESIKWPFFLEPEMRKITAFCKFNEELNRYTLRVKNLSTAKAKITWGAESKEFTSEQLASGINLTAEFDKSPLDNSFIQLVIAVNAKQAYETPMIKGMITNFRNFANDAKTDPEFAAALNMLKQKMIAKQEKLDAEARAKLVPVKHTIKVELLN
jgi:lysophospholipase L1-like esterase